MSTSPPLPHGIREVSRDILLALGPAERVDRITAALTAYYSSRTEYGDDDGWEDDQVDPAHPLILESAVAAEMNVVMQRWLGVTVPVETLLLDGVGIRGLAELLAAELDTSALRSRTARAWFRIRTAEGSRSRSPTSSRRTGSDVIRSTSSDRSRRACSWSW